MFAASATKESLAVGETNLSKLLSSMSPGLMPDEYVFCSVQGEYQDFQKLARFRFATHYRKLIFSLLLGCYTLLGITS